MKMKNIIIFMFVFTIYSCDSYQKNYDINFLKQKEHGHVIIKFRTDPYIDAFSNKVYPHFQNWRFNLAINKSIYIGDIVRGNKQFSFIIPSGNNTIEYKLHSINPDTIYMTGDSIFGPLEKSIQLNVKSDQTIYLIIVNIGIKETKLGCVGSGIISIPFPESYQEVAFEVEKVEDAKPEDINHNKLK